MMITISAGHYGPKTGAHGFIDEGTENIKVAKRVVEILQKAGIKTNYIQDTTNKNARDNVNWLVAEHNKTERQIDVQIHFNSVAGTHSRGIGTEVLIYNDNNKAVAQKLVDAIASVGFINRGVKKRTDLGFLARTNKPAFLPEICFVNDSVDVAIYRRDFEKICQAIASVLAQAVGKSIKPSANQSVEDKGGNQVKLLNETGRKECKEMIQRGVQEKLFTSPHDKVDTYTDVELISFAMAYANRKTKLDK